MIIKYSKPAIFTLITVLFYLNVSAQSGKPAGVNSYSLPKPSGRYGIGTAIFYGADSTRFDSAENKNVRDVIFQVWYPAKTASLKKLNYIPADLYQAMLKDHYNNVDSLTLRNWTGIRTYAAETAPVDASKKFPVIFFLHGFGISRYNYISIIEEIVSNGFVVVSVDSPHSGFALLPDGKTYPTIFDNKPVEKCESMAKDVSFILSWMKNTKDKHFIKIKNSIDLARPGVMGHSLGGAAALETCRIDSRFIACADLDGDTWGKVDEVGLNKPTLILLNAPIVKNEGTSTPEQKVGWEKMKAEHKKTWEDLVKKNPDNNAWEFSILGAAHFTFTDFPFVTKDYYKTDHFATAETIIKKDRGLQIISAYVTTFFSHYLTGNKPADVKKLPAVFPESSLYVETK